MSKTQNVYDALTEIERGSVATLLRCDKNSAGFRNLLSDTPVPAGDCLTLGDFARAVHAQIARDLRF